MLIFVFLPLMSSLICGFFGFYIGERGALLISNIAIFFSLYFVVLIFFNFIIIGNFCYIQLFPWIELGLFTVNWCFCLDSVSVVMSFVVLSVSLLVHFYSSGYMLGDPHIPRFMSYLSLFTFFMLILVTSDNFLQLFLGWEGVGLCSYLLVGFWFTRVQAGKSANKAIVINKVGDLSLITGIILVYFFFGSIDFPIVFCTASYVSTGYINSFYFIDFYILDLICLFFFLGTIGKSAQIGLHMWLPAAMEGPTPVSALIHAATMVTAGVFLIIKCSFIFEFSPLALHCITIIGSCTCLFAASVGITQNDIKRVVAYSTCSQLGYMVFVCGLSGHDVAFYHLFNHAFFKALLFLSAGAIIHSLGNEQDLRLMGGLRRLLPFSYTMMLIGSLSLAGFPFLSGFYSKDICLEIPWLSYEVDSIFTLILAMLSTILTAFYSFRLINLVFWGGPNFTKNRLYAIHESSNYMLLPLFLLSIFSIFSGYLFKDLFVGMGNSFWSNSLYVSTKSKFVSEVEFLPFYIKGLPVIFSFFGMFLVFYIQLFSFFHFFKTKFYYDLYLFLNCRWYIDSIINVHVNRLILSKSDLFFIKEIDKGILEFLGPRGLVFIFSLVVCNIKQKYIGRLQVYLVMLLFNIFVVMGMLLIYVIFL